MKAAVFRGISDIALEDVPEPQLRQPTDAILRITASAICGTDLHMIRGTMPGMKPGTVLGHEAVGVVEEVGPEVRNLSHGDRVVVPSTNCLWILLLVPGTHREQASVHGRHDCSARQG